MLPIKSILLFAAAATSVAADAASVYAKLVSPIDNPDIPYLSKNISAYPNSGSTGASIAILNIQKANKVLYTDIDAATSDASGSSAPSVADAQKILDYVKGQLYNDTIASLQLLDTKISNIRAQGYKGTVASEVNKTSVSVGNLAKALISKAPAATQKAQGSAISSSYSTQFASRINALNA